MSWLSLQVSASSPHEGGEVKAARMGLLAGTVARRPGCCFTPRRWSDQVLRLAQLLQSRSGARQLDPASVLDRVVLVPAVLVPVVAAGIFLSAHGCTQTALYIPDKPVGHRGHCP